MLESQQEEGSPVDTNPTPRADVQEDSEQGDKGGLLLPNGGTVARMHIHSRRRAGSREVTFLAAGRIRARYLTPSTGRKSFVEFDFAMRESVCVACSIPPSVC